MTVDREVAVATAGAVRAAEAEAPEAPAATSPRTDDASAADNGSAPKTPANHLAEGGAVATAKGTRAGRAAATAPDRVPDDWRITDDELAALDALGKEGVWHVDGVELKLTNLDKPLFEPREPDGGGPITKRELIRYFARIAPTMLPHLADRPLNLQRFPNGAGCARASGRRTSPTPRRSG